jgi:outer membrane protein OmpA-like peptidoglycan-associated protein
MKKAFTTMLLMIAGGCCAGQTFSLSDSVFETGAVYTPRIWFHFDSPVLNSASYPQLDSIVAFLERHPQLTLEVGAHVDSLELERASRYASHPYCRRGVNVAGYLAAKGINADRVPSRCYFARVPIVTEDQIAALADEKEKRTARYRNTRIAFRIVSMH